MNEQIPFSATAKDKTATKESRLAYIDWMRGLACVLMFQTHCYDSWLSPEARKSATFVWSQLGGTLPAPLFIFLSGISFALVTERLREKGAPAGAIAKTTIRRGAEIFGLGLLFRVQEYALGFGYAPWTDLLRVDVLNILGLSMMLMGVLCWLSAARGSEDSTSLVNSVAASRNRGILAAVGVAAIVAMATPPLWTTHRPRFLLWPLESYINGVHVYGNPQPWLFPMFPWVAFAFVGLAVGFFLFTNAAKRYEGLIFFGLGGTGILACLLSWRLDQSHRQLYAVYDYWHTSPNFLLMRCGILLIILFCVYAWCRWGLAQMGFSPIIQLGKTSLLVYWVHIEFVYGRFSILPKRQCTVLQATLGLLIVFLAMVVLSLLRTNWKNRRAKPKKLSAAPVTTQEV
ncbi:MAG TPA: heparan-alpha-glucosaminide N-acetyltransferase domain-containing protein [Candidatus Acidoferrum sp.]|nr:heparan-alpha-glucosaminide N-acetyltransferase domain-containing protein [Candidatus Acidoferrum sp.]